MSFTISLSDSTSSSHDFTTFFPAPISLKGPYEVALQSFNCFNTFFNISSAFSNNTFQYKLSGGSYTTLTLPNGKYTLTDLNTYIKAQLGTDSATFTLRANNMRNRCEIVLTTSTCIKFNSDLYIMLGFTENEELATDGVHIATNHPNFSRGIDRLYLNIDIIDSNYKDGASSQAVFEFVMSVPPAYYQEIIPNERYYNHVRVQSINSIHFSITDSQNRPVDLNGESTNCTLYFRPISN